MHRRRSTTTGTQRWSYPIELLDAASVNAAQLEQLRTVLSSNVRAAENSRYATELRKGDAVQRLLSGDWPVQWSSKYRFVADDPLKVTMTEQNAQTNTCAAALLPVVKAAQTDIIVISPYFVPGVGATEVLVTAGLGQASSRADQFARCQRRRSGARWLFASPQAAVDWRREACMN